METLTQIAENQLELIRAAQGLQPTAITKDGITTAIIRHESPFIQEIIVKVQ